MKMIHVRSGTTERSSDTFFSAELNTDGTYDFSITVSGQKVTVKGSYKDSASGGDYGEYGVTRIGLVELPSAFLIELTVRALLEGNYRLSDAEIKKLLLAISASIPSTKVK